MLKIFNGLGVFAVIAWLALIILGVIGWVRNLLDVIDTAHMQLAHITVLFVLRIIGIFCPPLGAFLGYIH